MSTPDGFAQVDLLENASTDKVVIGYAARIGERLKGADGPREVMLMIIGAAAGAWMTDRPAFHHGHAQALADLALEHLGLAAAAAEPPAAADPAGQST